MAVPPAALSHRSVLCSLLLLTILAAGAPAACLPPTCTPVPCMPLDAALVRCVRCRVKLRAAEAKLHHACHQHIGLQSFLVLASRCPPCTCSFGVLSAVGMSGADATFDKPEEEQTCKTWNLAECPTSAPGGLPPLIIDSL
jgi:hypothetical protein